MHAATCLEDIAVLRSELESLHEKIQKEETQGIAGVIKSCVENCHLIFDKVGRLVQSYEQLKEEKDCLMEQCQRLKDIIEQGG